MKVWLGTPSFCKESLLFDCLKHIYGEEGVIPKMTHVIIDNHYPINEERNSAQLKYLSDLFFCQYVDSGKDLGLHGGLNNAIKVVGVKPEDLWIGSDPDDRPDTAIFQAMIDVMNADPSMLVLSGMFWVIEEKIKQGVAFKEETIAGHKVLIHPYVEMWNVAAFRMSFILEIGGFCETYKYYGGLEAALYMEAMKRGIKFRLGYLKDFKTESKPMDRNDPILFDPELRLYKDAHIAGFDKSFKEWLEENKKGPK